MKAFHIIKSHPAPLGGCGEEEGVGDDGAALVEEAEAAVAGGEGVVGWGDSRGLRGGCSRAVADGSEQDGDAGEQGCQGYKSEQDLLFSPFGVFAISQRHPTGGHKARPYRFVSTLLYEADYVAAALGGGGAGVPVHGSFGDEGTGGGLDGERDFVAEVGIAGLDQALEDEAGDINGVAAVGTDGV